MLDRTSLRNLEKQVLEGYDRRASVVVQSLLKGVHPADIADLLDALDDEVRSWVFSLLDDRIASEVLDEALDESTLDLVESAPGERIADLLEELPSDDAAELLSELPPDQAETLISLMEPEEASEVAELLRYDEDTAGRLMTEKVVRVRRRWTVQETLDYLRTIDPETETLAYLYVVDDDDRLVGVVPLRTLVTAFPGALIHEVMQPDVISVTVDTDQEEVARLVTQYDFLAVPVVDRQGRLAGIITHDDVVDILQDEFTEDIQRIGGSQPLDRSYFSVSVTEIGRKRIGWLLLLFITDTLTGTVLRFFQADLSKVVALMFFVPLLIGTGGNAGSQTTTTIIRALAVGEVRMRDALRVLSHEFGVGLLLGLGMATVAFIRAVTWGTGLPVALAVSFSILAIILWATSLGSLLPLLATRLGIDPTVISGPAMSTLVDATGLFIYLSIARFILGM
ncbi:MAG: magnesium transporter [Chloroflexi bacterium]|nr:magnesium transporter [Chloroflexota bacterium]